MPSLARVVTIVCRCPRIPAVEGGRTPTISGVSLTSVVHHEVHEQAANICDDADVQSGVGAQRRRVEWW